MKNLLSQFDRREFLRVTTSGVVGAMLPYRLFAGRVLADTDEIVARFAVGGDLHFGQGEFEQNSTNLVDWMNRERDQRGLDMFFLNGDIVHDTTDQYLPLKERYLSKLQMPMWAVKGNHDFLAKEQTWNDIWEHPENHVIRQGDFSWIIADTSRADNQDSTDYTAADLEWLTKNLEEQQNQRGVFIIMHIAQRREGIDNWPKFGVGHSRPERAPEGEQVMQLIESTPNVVAVFHGHNHNERGRYLSGGKPYFFCSRLGHTWGNTIGYRIVEIYQDGTAQTYQYDPNADAVIEAHEINLKSQNH
jgi:3',5'-cyclic-AMP phosphodiesterase